MLKYNQLSFYSLENCGYCCIPVCKEIRCLVYIDVNNVGREKLL